MNKILIVEDDQIVANIYRNKFTVEGFQVEVARDGEAGLSMVRSFRPDAMVLDLMLPKVTGVELMKRLRAESEFAKLPVIVFSNTYMTNMVQEAWKAGATKCLSKANCTPQQVLETIRGALATNGTAAPTAARSTPAAIPASASPAPASTSEPELRKNFIASFPATLTVLRNLLKALIKAENEATRLKQVHELYRRIHSLTANAGITGMSQIAQMSDALEALLKELYEKPRNLNASTMRTVASGVDLLAVLFEKRAQSRVSNISQARILVVDDEAISRRAITYALEKAKLKSVTVEDSAQALEKLAEHHYDLIFLDIDMPGMNGFELCTKLRAMDAHKKTPVVFVTNLTDFESRANSTMSGGTDLIAKPFLFIELAVKALGYLLRAQLTPAAPPVRA
jgi:DNA-binding response OmpR family regulator